jgi:hypothetical protein
MQLLTIFSQSMEMKIELMQQGGLEFLIKVFLSFLSF